MLRNWNYFGLGLVVILQTTTGWAAPEPKAAAVQPTSRREVKELRYVEKELVFLNWGTGERDIVRRGGNSPSLKVDIYGNLYILDNFGRKLHFLSSDGKWLKAIIFGEEYGKAYPDVQLMRTDPNGEVFLHGPFRTGLKDSVVRILKDGSIKKYIIPDEQVPGPLETFPPRLEWPDIQSQGPDIRTLTISLHTIRAWAERTHKAIILPKSEVLVLPYPPLAPGDFIDGGDILGLDQNGLFYWLCGYRNRSRNNSHADIFEFRVYDLMGHLLKVIPLAKNIGSPGVPHNSIGFDLQGNLYRLWFTETGIKVIKWEKE
jgi:hypothetical protein